MTDIEEKALRILNALAPLSRKEEWWKSDGPIAAIEAELIKLYPPTSESLEDRVMDLEHRFRALEGDNR